jgi:hypothetical protein
MQTLIGGSAAPQSWPPGGSGASWEAARAMTVQQGRQARAARRFVHKTGAGVNKLDNKKLRSAVQRKSTQSAMSARAVASTPRSGRDRVTIQAPADQVHAALPTGPHRAVPPTKAIESAELAKGPRVDTAAEALHAAPLTRAAEAVEPASAEPLPGPWAFDTLVFVPDMPVLVLPFPSRSTPSSAESSVKGLDVAEKLGRFCDGVYGGMHSAASSLMRVYVDLRQGVVSAVNKALAWTPLSSPARASKAAPATAPVLRASDLTVCLDSALKATAVMDRFKGDAVTRANMHYLTESGSFRHMADEQGRGMGADFSRDPSSLARRLATAALNAKNPWSIIPGWASSDLHRAEHAEYTQYLNAVYPQAEFEAVEQRIRVYAAQDQAAVSALVESSGSEGMQQFAQDIAWMRRALVDLSSKLKEISSSQ